MDLPRCSRKAFLLLILLFNFLCVVAKLKFVLSNDNQSLWIEFFIEGFFNLDILPVAIIDMTKIHNLDLVLPIVMSNGKNSVLIFDEISQLTNDSKASFFIFEETDEFVNNNQIVIKIDKLYRENWSRTLFWFSKPVVKQTEDLMVSLCKDYFISPIVISSPIYNSSAFNVITINNVMDIKNNYLRFELNQQNVKITIRKVIQHIEKLERDFDGAELRVKVHPKYVLLQESEKKGLFGVDAAALHQTSKMLNFKVSLVMGIKNHFGNTFPNGSLVSSIADLKIHKIDLNLNRHVLITRPEVMLLPVLDTEDFCFILPYFRGNYAVTSLVRYLTPGTWVLVLLSVLSSAFIWRFMNIISKTEDYPTLSILQSFLSTRRFKVYSLFHMVFLASWDAFVFILLNIFRATVLKRIIKPYWIDEITNMEELLQSNLKIKNRIGIFQVARSNSTLEKLLNRSAVSYLIESDYEFQTSAYFTSKYFRLFLNIALGQQNRYYKVPECLSDCYVSYILAPRSPYFNGFQRNILYLQQYGFYHAWFQQFQYKSTLIEEGDDSFYFANSTRNRKKRPFTLTDLIFAFYIQIFGLLLSTVVFLCELMLSPWEGRGNGIPFMP